MTYSVAVAGCTGYAGGEVICSAPGLAVVGNSASFITTDGAASFSIGQTISGIQSSAKTSTVITGRNKVSYLTGNNATDFVLSDVSADSGAVPDTLVSIGQLHFLDDIGVRSMTSAQEFGDWNIGTVTERIEPLLRQKREAGVGVIGALRVRAKNQYRLFYDDATAITIYFGRPQPECMTLAMGFTPECLHSGEDSDGNEILLAGTDDGWVYRLDVGNSQDGEAIQYYLRFGFMHQGDPTVNKRYHRAILSVANGGPETTITYSSDFSYGDPDQPSGVDFTLAMPGAGGFWDVADWDRFYWDARVQSDAFAELNGIGTNVSLAVVGESSDEESHTLSSMTIFYSPRRSLR